MGGDPVIIPYKIMNRMFETIYQIEDTDTDKPMDSQIQTKLLYGMITRSLPAEFSWARYNDVYSQPLVYLAPYNITY